MARRELQATACSAFIFIVTGFLREARFCASPLLLYAFHRCGFCGQILAKITMCKFRILRQRQVEALDLVDLQAQAVCGQSKDMPALRLISAEVMEVPAGQVDAVYIGRGSRQQSHYHEYWQNGTHADSLPLQTRWDKAFRWGSSCVHAWS